MKKPRSKAYTIAKWVLIALLVLFLVTRVIRFVLQ